LAGPEIHWSEASTYIDPYIHHLHGVVGLPDNSYKPINNTVYVRARLCKLQKGCTQLSAASDKVYQLLAHGRWFDIFGK
jgi:hypothetical protein